METSGYDRVCGPLGVLNGAVAVVPPEVSNVAGALIFVRLGEVVPLEAG